MSVPTSASTAGVPAHALRRGTRGFAAVVLLLTGMIVFAVTLFAVPSSAIGREALTILIPLGIAFSFAHLVAIYGVLRRRHWVAPLALYLLAIGLGLVTFMMLLVRGGVDPLAPAQGASTDPATLLGLLVWLAGSWIVAARFVLRGMAPPETRLPTQVPEEHGTGVTASHPIVVAAGATRARPELRAGSAST